MCSSAPRSRLFGRYGWRDLDTFDQPPLPLPSGGAGNGTIYARNKQLALGTHLRRRAIVAARGPLRLVDDAGRQEPAGARQPSAQDDFGITGLPSDPRIAGGLPTQLIGGYADLGRQATNPQWQYPTVWNPKVNYTWLMGRQSLKAGYEFQNVERRSAGRQPAVRPRHLRRPVHPAADRHRAPNNLYNLADFMLGLRSQYALSNVLVAQMRQEHALHLPAGRRPRQRST